MAGVAYWTAVGIGAALAVGACVVARQGGSRRVRLLPGRVVGTVLAVDAVVFLGRPLVDGTWSARSSLPLDLCDVALVVAAVACWLPQWRTGVELTWFWGLAGTLQAVLTPDLSSRFPSLPFLLFVIAHLGIVIAAAYLVIGLRMRPRRWAIVRVYAITVVLTAIDALVDRAEHADYMYLARPPAESTLLSVLGPWPWYILSAAGVALVMFVVLDAPFWKARRS